MTAASSNRFAVVSLAGVVALFALACRDFAYPKEPLPGTGPVLSFENPRHGDAISLVQAVRVNAEDPTGVGTVILSCSGLRLFQWTSAPYEAAIDFGPCRKLDGGETQALTLSLEGSDRQGNATAPDRDAGSIIDVTLNSSAPSLSVEAPQRVRPNEPFTVRITISSDAGLQGLPTLREGNQTVPVADQGGGVFVATVPGRALGADLGDGGTFSTADDIAALEQTSRDVDFAIEARALNGNAARRDVRVQVSRFVWERAIPGVLSRRHLPVGTAAGLQLPLESGGSSWRPGLLRASDGTFVPFPAALAAQGDGGAAIDPSSGDALLVSSGAGVATDGGALRVLLPPGESAPLGAAREGQFGTRFVDPGASPRAVAAFGGFCEELFDENCATTRGFRCVTAAGDELTLLSPDDGGVALSPASALSGNDAGIFGLGLDTSYQYASCFGQRSCGAFSDCANVVVTARAKAASIEQPFGFRLLPFEKSSPARVYPAEDGRFGVYFRRFDQDRFELFDLSGPTTRGFPVLRSPPPDDGGLQDEGFLPPEFIAGVLPSGDVLTAEPAGQRTAFIRRGVDPLDAGVWANLPGSYQARELDAGFGGGGNDEVAPRTVVRGQSAYVLLYINATTPAVLSLSPTGPRWIFRYPRASSHAELFGGASGPLYLVDLTNNLVVAIAE